MWLIGPGKEVYTRRGGGRRKECPPPRADVPKLGSLLGERSGGESKRGSSSGREAKAFAKSGGAEQQPGPEDSS